MKKKRPIPSRFKKLLKQTEFPYQTKREYIIAHKEFERGMIKAWTHAETLLKSFIKAHEELLTDEYLFRYTLLNRDKFEKAK